MQLKYVLLLVAFAVAEKQIKLEDIERDNLLSERQVSVKPDDVDEQNQNLQPPPPPLAIQSASSSYENSGENVSVQSDLNEDIVYAPTGNTAEEYQSSEQQNQQQPQQQVQYVTPSQYEQQKEFTRQTSAYTRPVHEASSHTYSAPARQSLIHPIVHKPNGTPSPYLGQQPRYVYVQAGDQQLQSNGILTYGQPQHSIENAERQNAQDDIAYASIEQNQLLDTSQQSAHAPTPRPGITYGPPRNFVQYVPFLPPNPSSQNYIMIFRSSPATHSHTQAYAVPHVPAIPNVPAVPQVPAIQYNSIENDQHLQPPPNQRLAAPQPTVSYAARPNTLEETAVLHAPESTGIPSFQYIIPAGSHHVTAQVPLQLQQPIEYALQPQHHHLDYHAPVHQKPNYLQHFSQHFTPTLDLFGQYNKHPLSLLDSYIPSSVVLARQRGQLSHLGGGGGRNLLHTVPQATHLIQQGSHQPGYNTIAYSTHQDYSGYAKRSPKFTKTNKKNY